MPSFEMPPALPRRASSISSSWFREIFTPSIRHPGNGRPIGWPSLAPPASDKRLRALGAAMNWLSKRDRLVVALFAFVTLGTALVVLNWIVGWY
jgi:hypothetical protein